MILKECVDSKYAAQARHFSETKGNPRLYARLLTKKYETAMKRRKPNGSRNVAATK